MFLIPPKAYDEKGMKKIKKVDLTSLINGIKTIINVHDLENLKEGISNFCKENEIGMGVVMQTLRMAVVGSLSGPDIIEVIKVIGKMTTLDRLELLKKTV
jgi:glutamyl-tRNA synthetase